MNTRLNRLIPERNRSDADPQPTIARRPRLLPSVTVEYDDGNPATIVPIAAPPSIQRDAIRPDGDGGAIDPIRRPLRSIARNRVVEYDDGEPATIVC